MTHSLAPEKFARVRALFEAALKRPARERQAYLEGACGSDRALLEQVEGMLAAEAKEGVLDGTGSSSSSTSPEEGRFPAGSTLADRYRILGLLGRGGMGEVYRAFDIRLNQTVALKFLPEAARRNPRLLERFRSEVRIARQISHRNVCRVYDLGEFEDMPFLSMEYVDGEDLRSLLRRIGRLPGDKAIEIARKLCAGLAAAHEKGVLHRDLKPANIMIDGQGQVRIMDFGLAAMADAIVGGDIRSGTPAYMAPEQSEGREVTVRSDLYSLGLVLAEMFTGQSTKTKDGRLSTNVKDLDPLVEQAIERCLDRDPSRRPDSAIALARMLPGGDPLAEALAAGDTPSPAMVAASDEMGVLPVWGAMLALAAVVLSLAGIVFWTSNGNLVNILPLPYSLDVLEQKSREMAARFGYSEVALDKVRDFYYDLNLSEWASDSEMPRKLPEEYRSHLEADQPAIVYFSYLQCPQYVTPLNVQGNVFSGDPPRVPGCVDVRTDTLGRLVSFQAMPRPGTTPAPEPLDWNHVLGEAGLDPSRWTAADPKDFPAAAFDERRAWVGSYPGSPNVEVRIEAAAWQGRLTSFETFGPWRSERDMWRGGLLPQGLVGPMIFVVLVAVGVPLAVMNFRSGRGDWPSAVRLGLFVVICNFLSSFFETHHTPSVFEFITSGTSLGYSLLLGAMAWVLYLALEPFVRRYWPQALIGWTRVVAGRLRDPIVGGQILVGLAAGLVVSFSRSMDAWLSGIPLNMPLIDVGRLIGTWFGAVSFPPAIALAFMLIFVLLRRLLRHPWVVAPAAVLVLGLLGFNGHILPALISAIVMTTVALRFGLLAMTWVIATGSAPMWALTPHFDAWYAPLGWLAAGPYLVLAFWSFRTALGGRKVLPAGSL